MAIADDPGYLLRVWREHAGMTVSTVAGLLRTPPSAISMLERGQRGQRAEATVELVARFAACTAGAPTLVDLWRAAKTVEGLPPRAVWWHNFAQPGQPAWAWLRPTTLGTVRASFWWGDPLQGRLAVSSGTDGVLVTFPSCVPNPPLRVTFDQDVGWVDFGLGTVPAAVAERLGVRLVASPDLQTTGTAMHTPLGRRLQDDRILSYLLPGFRRVRAHAERMGLSWTGIAPHLGLWRPDPTPHLFETTAQPDTGGDAARGGRAGLWLAETLYLTPAQLQRLRQARGYSRSQAAKAATKLDPGYPVAAKTVEHLESGARPSTRHLIPRLDTLYRADGHLGIEAVPCEDRPDRRGRHVVHFPVYWVGPVVILVEGPERQPGAVVELTWGPLRRRQVVRAGTLLTLRKAPAAQRPLLLQVPAGWRVCAAVGVHPSAIDVNRGWRPASVAAAVALLRDGLALVGRAPTTGHQEFHSSSP